MRKPAIQWNALLRVSGRPHPIGDSFGCRAYILSGTFMTVAQAPLRGMCIHQA
jgi:hypothetical protein